MTLAELATILKSTGYPVSYSHFISNNVPPPPFITYQVDDSANFFADNRVYKKISNISIELYTDKKDLEAEAALESALDANHLVYETTEIWIEAEKLFQKIYEIGVV
ncbi:hypothetical protein GCM10007416_32030 [Kroppenstedtia guangzhouensis]|uniref:Phage protein n=1 Tax=Kroppenstedtia guangzhouensis TaxID=1274356 RepID=A0ABQ1H2Z7_9BACL|nr:hypothetical protein [Kroppenstedtia guangzhouensis]GGA56432.1 hypothetical protein GCM10007416_32030 [Kroppenstedtia guangzhouensis]